jgi:shikimate kinase
VTAAAGDVPPGRDAATRPRLILVGPPGAGKSTIATILARRWRVERRDTDADVEAMAGKPISDIFVDDGESAFRELERAAVAAALAEHTGVLSLGGGAVTQEETRALLAGHTVVFLDVGLAEAASRVGLATTRPLLLGNVRGQLKALMDARRPLYAAVATHTVQTDGRTLQEVAAAVEAAVAASEQAS